MQEQLFNAFLVLDRDACTNKHLRIFGQIRTVSISSTFSARSNPFMGNSYPALHHAAVQTLVIFIELTQGFELTLL